MSILQYTECGPEYGLISYSPFNLIGWIKKIRGNQVILLLKALRTNPTSYTVIILILILFGNFQFFISLFCVADAWSANIEYSGKTCRNRNCCSVSFTHVLLLSVKLAAWSGYGRYIDPKFFDLIIPPRTQQSAASAIKPVPGCSLIFDGSISRISTKCRSRDVGWQCICVILIQRFRTGDPDVTVYSPHSPYTSVGNR